MKTKKLLMVLAILALPAFTWAQDVKTQPPQPLDPNKWELWISLSPILLFLIILLSTIFKLKKDQVKLSDLFEEKEKDCQKNSNNVNQAQNSNQPAGPAANAKPTQSVSRFIAFITGLTSLVIGVCIATFFMYCYFKNPQKPVDLSNLTTVIFGLGIGVLPYGFNKASAAVKP